MSLRLTLLFCGLTAAAAIFAGWRGARPPDPRRGPRMLPWRFLMMLAAAVAMLFLVHAANLLGLGPER
jgi:hypothetical protein